VWGFPIPRVFPPGGVCGGGGGGGGREGFGIATLKVASMVINDDVARIHQSPRVV